MNKTATVMVPATITPMAMIDKAVASGASVEQLKSLMDLQERWEANEARKAFVVAMSAFKADPPDLIKSSTANFGKHASLDHVTEKIGTALSGHGLSHRWDVDQSNNLIKVTCVITHELGHSERTPIKSEADTSGAKNSIQAIGSAITYLQRYSLLAATGLAAREADDDGTLSEGPITPEQLKALETKIDLVGADKIAFIKHLKVDSLAELPASQFKKADAALEAKRAAK